MGPEAPGGRVRGFFVFLGQKVTFSWILAKTLGGDRENRNPSGNSNTNLSWRARKARGGVDFGHF